MLLSLWQVVLQNTKLLWKLISKLILAGQKCSCLECTLGVLRGKGTAGVRVAILIEGVGAG